MRLALLVNAGAFAGVAEGEAASSLPALEVLKVRALGALASGGLGVARGIAVLELAVLELAVASSLPSLLGHVDLDFSGGSVGGGGVCGGGVGSDDDGRGLFGGKGSGEGDEESGGEGLELHFG